MNFISLFVGLLSLFRNKVKNVNSFKAPFFFKLKPFVLFVIYNLNYQIILTTDYIHVL